MRLAFFLAKFPVLSETFVMRQIQAMHDLGHSVTIITALYDECISSPISNTIDVKLFRTDISSYEISRTTFFNILRSPLKKSSWAKIIACCRVISVGLYSPIIDILKTGQSLGEYDYIIAHFGPAGVRAMFLREAGLIKGKIVTIFHGFDISRHDIVRKYLKGYKRLFKTTELQAPISQLWAQRLLNWGAIGAKVKVIHVGVDLSVLLPVQPRRSNKSLRIVTVARLVEKKGIKYAIEGVEKSSVCIEYRIVGDGPLRESLQSLPSPPKQTVSFEGARSHGDALNIVREADVFLLPSVVAEDGDMEGIPVSLMEAMASGIIVLATRHSGIPELVDHGITGFLVEEKNSDAIASMVNYVWENFDHLDVVRTSAREKIVKHFNNSIIDKRFEAILESRLECNIKAYV